MSYGLITGASSQKPLNLFMEKNSSSNFGRAIIAKGRGQKAEGKRLTAQSFSILLCPNRLGDCHSTSRLSIPLDLSIELHS